MPSNLLKFIKNTFFIIIHLFLKFFTIFPKIFISFSNTKKFFKLHYKRKNKNSHKSIFKNSLVLHKFMCPTIIVFSYYFRPFLFIFRVYNNTFLGNFFFREKAYHFFLTFIFRKRNSDLITTNIEFSDFLEFIFFIKIRVILIHISH